MLDRGYLTIAKIRGAPIRFHWSLVLGLLFFTGFRFAPGAWLGFIVIILLHELGHAVLVWRGGLRVTSIDVAGYGGLCRYEGGTTERWRSVIAWGGVAAQALLLVASVAITRLLPPTQNVLVAQLLDVMLMPNAALILFNLVPIPPLDGAEAWKLLGYARARRKTPKPQAAYRSPVFRTKKDVDVTVSDEVAERIARDALAQAAEEAARKRRDGNLH